MHACGTHSHAIAMNPSIMKNGSGTAIPGFWTCVATRIATWTATEDSKGSHKGYGVSEKEKIGRCNKSQSCSGRANSGAASSAAPYCATAAPYHLPVGSDG